MVKSLISVLGWIEVELGILGLGCILAIFWVTDCTYDKGVPVVLGSHQIKKVYSQARIKNSNYWPAPWKDLYTWSAVNKWYGDRHSKTLDDLYDSDDYDSDNSDSNHSLIRESSKQVVRPSSLSSADSWLELVMEEESEKTILGKVEAKIAASSSTTLKGIPPRIVEACQEPPTVEAPSEEEPSQLNNGDDLSVFKTLASELDPNVEGPDDHCTCNLGKETEHFFQLCPNSTIICRITPTGEAFLHF